MPNFTTYKATTFFLLTIFITANISKAQWQADSRLTNDPAFSATTFNTATGLAADGNTLHTVWFDERDGNREIYYKRSSDNGLSWGTDIRLTNNSAASDFPSLSMSGQTVHVVWEDCRDPSWEIYYKQSTDGGISWGNDVRLTVSPGTSSSPASSVSGSDVHVVWFDNRDGNNEIYYKHSGDGGVSWGPDTRLTVNSAASNNPSVSVSGKNVHVAWEDYRNGSNAEIYYKRSTDNGASWSADTRLTVNTSFSRSPSVVAEVSDVHIVWFDGRDGNSEIYHKLSADDGASWGTDKRITNNWAVSSYSSLSVSGSNVYVAWIDERDGNLEVYFNKSADKGINWGSDLRLTNNVSRSTDPYVLASGPMVHVIWTDARDAGHPYNGNYEIYYKQNPAANSGPFNLNISMIIEGFYDASTHIMNMQDSVRAFLRSATAPFGFIDSARSMIDNLSFTGSFSLSNTPQSSYYIVLKHRSGMETWSRIVSGSSGRNSGAVYDFTGAMTQAFGSNMKQVDFLPDRFAIFSGDINGDGCIASADVIGVYNSTVNFTSGYVPADVNGDGFVNLTDLTITYNNSISFIAMITP